MRCTITVCYRVADWYNMRHGTIEPRRDALNITPRAGLVLVK